MKRSRNITLTGEWPDGKPFKMSCPRSVVQPVAKTLARETHLDLVTAHLPEGGTITYRFDATYSPEGVTGLADGHKYTFNTSLAL